MFSEFFKKEFFTGLKRPMIYIFMFIVGLLVFGAEVSDNVQIGGVVGDVKKNAPNVVSLWVAILSIFGMLFAAAFFNNAARPEASRTRWRARSRPAGSVSWCDGGAAAWRRPAPPLPGRGQTPDRSLPSRLS